MRNRLFLIAALLCGANLFNLGCDPSTGNPPVDDDDVVTDDDDVAGQPAQFQISARDADGLDLGTDLVLMTGAWNHLSILDATVSQVEGVTQHSVEVARNGVPVEIHLYASPCAPRAMWVCATQTHQYISYTEMEEGCEGGTVNDGNVAEDLDYNMSSICSDPTQIYIGATCAPIEAGYTWEISYNGGPSEVVYATLSRYDPSLGTGFLGIGQTELYVDGYHFYGGSFNSTIDPTTDCFNGTDGSLVVSGCRM